ncbi:hypothetical protein SI859A1_02078 [Aurantimonas manganoxydans SI85-9A1]|uniref:Uncharacterized protein n=2 Tax=Aurantimonas manganoxydans TaxID=651183 RepID=Q1YMW8_AURMS|nr:hypothetical protein SI859A1_02078 [Aurantimonas manganoxydans SI85-9A1]
MAMRSISGDRPAKRHSLASNRNSDAPFGAGAVTLGAGDRHGGAYPTLGTRLRRFDRTEEMWRYSMDQTQKQAVEAVARAAATGSLMIVRQTARRIAAANAITDEERIDDLARFIIAEGGRLGVAMEPGSREAVERLKNDGAGTIVAL